MCDDRDEVTPRIVLLAFALLYVPFQIVICQQGSVTIQLFLGAACALRAYYFQIIFQS
jgi:hypothetical protein